MVNNPLPGLPLIESPLFPSFVADLGLNAEEARIGLELFHRGYAVMDFPDPDIHQRINRIKESLGPRYSVGLEDPESDKTCGERRIQDAWRFDEDVLAIAANAEVKALLSRLYWRAAFPSRPSISRLARSRKRTPTWCTSPASRRSSCAAFGSQWKTSPPRRVRFSTTPARIAGRS